MNNNIIIIYIDDNNYDNNININKINYFCSLNISLEELCGTGPPVS